MTAKGRAALRASGKRTAKKNCRVKAGKHRGWFKKCRKGETARDYKKKTQKVSEGKSAKRVAAGKKLAASLPRVNGKFAKRGAIASGGSKKSWSAVLGYGKGNSPDTWVNASEESFAGGWGGGGNMAEVVTEPKRMGSRAGNSARELYPSERS